MTAGRPRTTAITLVIGGIVSVQSGAAIATKLFNDVGPVGAVALRLFLSAVILAAMWRPSVRLLRGAHRRDLILFGLALAAMNTSFYLALDRIPLGIAVTLEFVGPLGVAIAGSRQPVDFVWAGLAAVGIALLSPGVGGNLDALGACLALFAGACWAAYIYLAARVGAAFADGAGLALAMVIAGVLLIPFGVAVGGSDLLDLRVLALGVAVAILSSVIPYSFELEALRRLPTAVFGVLMSLEPAVAAIIGFVALSQDLGVNETLAIGCVVVASAGALRGSPAPVEA
jgi:inner membrane transporter RhtA